MCLKIVSYDEYSTDAHLHNTDLFDEINDDDICHLTHINNVPTTHTMSSHDIATSVNVIDTLQSQSPSCTFKQLDDAVRSCYLHKLQFNIDEPQIDSGANKSVTNDKNILQHFKAISPIPVYGVGNDDVACHLTGVGQITLQTDSNTSLQIKVYYSPTCSATILSPNAIVRESHTFTSWSQTSHLDIGLAVVQFFNRQNPHSRIDISLHMHNSLWFSRQPYLRLQATASTPKVCYLSTTSDDVTIINKLNKNAKYEL